VTPAADSRARARRVLLTRSEEDCAEWAERFAALGATPVTLPCIHAETTDTSALRTALTTAAAQADWLVFTSRRGVEAFVTLGGGRAPATRIAVVGASTAAAAEHALGRVDVVGQGGTAAALAATLIDSGALATQPRIVLPLAANAGDTLERAFTAAGARCTRFDVYRTVPAPPAEPKRAMSALGADNVILASPTAVTGFLHQVVVDVPIEVFTIGPSTSAAARAAGLAVTAEARAPSLEGILEAMQWQK
jgi:uroporphyrinogen-III synthase